MSITFFLGVFLYDFIHHILYVVFSHLSAESLVFSKLQVSDHLGRAQNSCQLKVLFLSFYKKTFLWGMYWFQSLSTQWVCSDFGALVQHSDLVVVIVDNSVN